MDAGTHHGKCTSENRMESATEDAAGKIRIGTQARTQHLEKLSGYRARRRIPRREAGSANPRRFRFLSSIPI